MTLSEIGDAVKLAMLAWKFMKSPEEALLKCIDDFKNADSTDISNIKSGICKKVKCSDIILEPGDSSINIKFINVNEPIDKFAVSIASFIFNLGTKISPFLSMFVPDTDINKSLEGLSVTHDETKNSTFIEIPIKEGTMKLYITSIPEDKLAIIKIPIESEKVLSKLREIKEE